MSFSVIELIRGCISMWMLTVNPIYLTRTEIINKYFIFRVHRSVSPMPHRIRTKYHEFSSINRYCNTLIILSITVSLLFLVVVCIVRAQGKQSRKDVDEILFLFCSVVHGNILIIKKFKKF